MNLLKLRKWAAVGGVLVLGLLLPGCTSLNYYKSAGPFNTVVLDAGHGGRDLGAHSVAGRPEKVHALDITLRVAEILRRAGYNVILTRSSDVFIPLPSRAAISNRSNDSVFVSLHLNWTTRRGADGLETHFYSPRSKRLAANIQYEICRVYRTDNRGIKPARFHVLRNNRRPAVLVELGFLSNRREAKLMESATHRQRLADAIARGIMAEDKQRIP
ncbi:MAG: N-acetylmuramoyl-L-alanine amidase [Chthoniobacterales bacterium]